MKVFVLFDYDTSSSLYSSLMIFYTMMLRFSIFDRKVDFIALVILMIVVLKTAFFYSMIVIH